MIRVLTILFASVLATSAYAFDITIGVPPGGVTGKTATILQEILKKNSLTSEIITQPNCAVVKNMIENEKKPMVYLAGSWGVVDDACALTYNDSVKVLSELYYYSYSVCYRKDKAQLGMVNFLDKSIKKNIAITTASNNIIQKIIAKFNLGDSANTVVVGNSAKAREVILGNEFDYTLVDTEWLGKNLDKVDCLFTGSDNDIANGNTNIPSVYNLLKSDSKNIPPLQDSIVLIGANLSPEQSSKINAELKIVFASNEWKSFINEFGRVGITTNGKFSAIVKSIRNE